jgi:hypothetical protein
MPDNAGDFVLGVVLSVGGAVLLLALIFLIAGATLRLRLRTLRAAFPQALVFNGYPAADFASGLRMLGAGEGRSGALGFGVVVDHEGITLWQGLSHITPFATLRWADGSTVSSSAVTSANGRSSAGLVVRASVEGRTIVLPLQVAKQQLISFDVAKNPEVVQLVDAITKLNRGATVPPAVRSPAASTVARRNIELVSAWTAARFARLMMVLYPIGAVASILLALTFVFSGTRRGDPAPSASQPLFAVMIVLGALSTIVVLGFRRARHRETAAGYTTLPRGDVNLPYVDPVTGVVLREAGEPHLTNAELKAAARDRKMAH